MVRARDDVIDPLRTESVPGNTKRICIYHMLDVGTAHVVAVLPRRQILLVYST